MAPGLHGGFEGGHNGVMGLLSDLVAQGRVRNREDLRRVYRRLVKKLHPDSAGAFARARDGAVGGAAVGAAATTFVDFDKLKKELGEAERLLAELDAAESVGTESPATDSFAKAPAQGGAKGAKIQSKTDAASLRTKGSRSGFDRALLIGELRDLVARGFPVQPRALARNKAYRIGVATVSCQLSLLMGEADAFERVDADMRVVRASSLSLIYHVMQVLWNGLDWGMMGMEWSRHAALRDYGTIKDELEARKLVFLDRLLAWIIEADRGADFGARAGPSRI